MVKLFEKLNKLTQTLNNPNTNYWETNSISWDREAKGPNDIVYDEKSLYESIRESDVKRLLKFQ